MLDERVLKPIAQLPRPVRLFRKVFLLTTLAACGAPGTEDVFTTGNPKIPAADSAPKAPVVRLATRAYAGLYRRGGDENHFQPCGTRVPLDLTGTAQARRELRDRVRWSSVWEGAKLYGIFQGAIVTDTPKTRDGGSDSARAVPRTRFFIVGVDSLRPWHAQDCGGMRVP